MDKQQPENKSNQQDPKFAQLLKDIEKGWDGPVSHRTVEDIINAKRPKG